MLRKEKLQFFARPTAQRNVYDQNFYCGGAGMVNGEGVTVKND